MGTNNNMGTGMGRGEDGAGRRWGKGEKAGTTVNSINNKTKTKKKRLRGKCFIVNHQLIQAHVFIFHMILVKNIFTFSNT